MRLYLVQHGEALTKDVDPERPLSEGGRRDVGRTAAFLGTAGVRVAVVAHSGKARALETAEILAAAVAPGSDVAARSGIAPKDPAETVAREAEGWVEDGMLVGHQPFMGRLVSLLVTGSEDAGAVAFQPGSVACLERGDAGQWTLAWMLRPELLAGG